MHIKAELLLWILGPCQQILECMLKLLLDLACKREVVMVEDVDVAVVKVDILQSIPALLLLLKMMVSSLEEAVAAAEATMVVVKVNTAGTMVA